MIEDMRHLQVVDDMVRELQVLINQYNGRCNGVTDKQELVTIRLEQNERLTELLRQQKRALRFQIGLPIEPEAHRGETILTGFGGVQ